MNKLIVSSKTIEFCWVYFIGWLIDVENTQNPIHFDNVIELESINMSIDRNRFGFNVIIESYELNWLLWWIVFIQFEIDFIQNPIHFDLIIESKYTIFQSIGNDVQVHRL